MDRTSILYPLIFEDILSLKDTVSDVCGLNRIPVLAVNVFLISSDPVLNPTSGTESIFKSLSVWF